MSIAFLFPGQGAESPGMGLELADRSERAAALLAAAGEAAGVDVRRVLQRGGPELDRTEVLQPTLVAVCLAALAELEALGLQADWVAGHSLGELCAWCAAGCITPRQAVALAGARGRLMASQARACPGGMVALRGCGEEVVEEALRRGRRRGIVDLAAHNGPRLWVLSGQHEAVEAAAGGLPAQRVRVTGPWHSRLMAAAVEPLRQLLRGVAHDPPVVRLVDNRTGRPSPPNRLPDRLAEQLCRPVRWAETLASLWDAGATDFVTVGPGHVLRGLLRDNLGSRARVHATETPRALAATLEALQ